jgi:hypothetical protein
MVPADGNFTTAIAKGNAKAGEVQGQTRQHSVLINLLGVKQLMVGVNKMDCDVAGYGEARYTEIRDEMVHMLKKVGWKKNVIDSACPVMPISGWMGDNLIKKSEKMAWWKGMDVDLRDGSAKVCLCSCLSPPQSSRGVEGLSVVGVSCPSVLSVLLLTLELNPLHFSAGARRHSARLLRDLGQAAAA